MKKQIPNHLQTAQVSDWWILVKILLAAWHWWANSLYLFIYFTLQIDRLYINAAIIHWLFDFVLPLLFVVALEILCNTVICLKSWKIKSNSIPMSRSMRVLNYFSVWSHWGPKMSAMQTNVVICRAFYHARFGTLGSITNEIVLLRGPSGEIWWFPLSVRLDFFPHLSIIPAYFFLSFSFFSFYFVVCPPYFLSSLPSFLSQHIRSLQTTFMKPM